MLPNDAIAFLRALFMLELIAAKLYPPFDLADTFQKFFEQTPIADAIAIPEAHAEEIASINEFESLETVDISPEATSESAMRATEKQTLEKERFEGWMTTLTERFPDLYQETKYL